MNPTTILANPPFNIKSWNGKRCKCAVPLFWNANFAWVQDIIHHLAPTGYASFLLANGSMSSLPAPQGEAARQAGNQSGEGEIRKNIIEADLVDCMVALPGQLFYSTQIPACLWSLARDKKNGRFRDRRGEVLFIDTRKMGQRWTAPTKIGRAQRHNLSATRYLATNDKEEALPLEEAIVLLREVEEEFREAGRELNPVLKLLGLGG